ncbi:hupE-UreJ family metal transporter [Agarivorans albus MKT 106]|uniref:HupE-UreJ family metal transporter n=1 Tax=Agarivorans albus MKT 106 TaxID=1331007 RepID=R9PH46_AGAAL|nr:HupE/UreJ family protein [Agarivorans albus]GAD00714.1 hupE-UreJ family metal transporter [Agarivorans albus MKT 106]
MKTNQLLSILAAMLLLSFNASAHEVTGFGGGFVSGFVHPVLGVDHVVAMIAVGLWGALLGAPALWVLPVVFPLVMAFGGVLGIIGLPIPAVETGIATSAVVFGGDDCFCLEASLAGCGHRRCHICYFFMGMLMVQSCHNQRLPWRIA